MSEATIWPEGARCAVVITINYDGESVERGGGAEGALWGRYSYGRYGVQSGLPRILDLLASHELAATFFVPGWDVERDPESVQAIQGAGHELGGHGYLHEDFSLLSADEQAATLEKSEAAFESVLGVRPEGWRAPGGMMTSATRPLLAGRGYRYDSSFCDDDVPYLAAGEDGARLVEIPVFQTASDSHYYRVRRPPDVVKQALTSEFSAMYRVGGLFNLTLHPRGDFGSGRAVRLRAVDGLLNTIRQYPDVWFTTCGELADWSLGDGADALETWPI